MDIGSILIYNQFYIDIMNYITSFIFNNVSIGNQIMSVLENSASFEILNGQMYQFEKKNDYR